MNKTSQLAFLLLILTFVGCSNLSKNSVKEGSYLVRNGTFSDKVWKENLELKRLSWYHELTLQFDVMIASIPSNSGFNFWFSSAELLEVNKCSDFRLVLAYSLDTRVLPYSLLNEQLENGGYKKIDLIEFRKHLLQHPDSEMNSMKLYQVFGICKMTKDLKPLIFNFPGFSEKSLN